MDSDDTKIVWRLSRARKGAYVLAARTEGKTLIQWVEEACDRHLEGGAGAPGGDGGENPPPPKDGGRAS